MGRPKANKNLKQDCKMTCYITETEYKAMKLICEKMGFTVSQFMRKAMLKEIRRLNEEVKDNG